MELNKEVILKAVVPAVVPMAEQFIEAKWPEVLAEIDKISDEYVKLAVKGLAPAMKDVLVDLMKKAAEKYA